MNTPFFALLPCKAPTTAGSLAFRRFLPIFSLGGTQYRDQVDPRLLRRLFLRHHSCRLLGRHPYENPRNPLSAAVRQPSVRRIGETPPLRARAVRMLTQRAF